MKSDCKRTLTLEISRYHWTTTTDPRSSSRAEAGQPLTRQQPDVKVKLPDISTVSITRLEHSARQYDWNDSLSVRS